jgi:hypothetical protein
MLKELKRPLGLPRAKYHWKWMKFGENTKKRDWTKGTRDFLP